MKKLSILKRSEAKDFRKDLTICCLLATGFGLLQFILAFILDLFGLMGYSESFGIVYLIYCVITSIVIYAINKDYMFDKEITREKPTAGKFFKLFPVMVCMMIFFTVPVVILDIILNQFGYTLQSVANANEMSDSITEFIYVAFAGPICEELIFRGLIQRRLEKYSPVIAVLVSGICFGVYHGNFSQIFPMIGTGIILGYAAQKYSIKLSIAMHIVYNFVFGELFGLLSSILSKNGEEFVIPIINRTPFELTIMFFAFAGITILCYQFFKKDGVFKEYRIRLGKVMTIFQSVGFDVFLVYALTTSILLIEKL